MYANINICLCVFVLWDYGIHIQIIKSIVIIKR